MKLETRYEDPREDLIDPVSGIKLNPSPNGSYCAGNPKCCDECDFYLECYPEHTPDWDALFARKDCANVSPLPAAESK